MKQTARQMLDSPEFSRMVTKRWPISIVLTVALFVIYYGYIVLIAVNKPFMARKIGDVTTLGIPLGVAVILALVGADGPLRDLGEQRLRPGSQDAARASCQY